MIWCPKNDAHFFVLGEPHARRHPTARALRWGPKARELNFSWSGILLLRSFMTLIYNTARHIPPTKWRLVLKDAHGGVAILRPPEPLRVSRLIPLWCNDIVVIHAEAK